MIPSKVEYILDIYWKSFSLISTELRRVLFPIREDDLARGHHYTQRLYMLEEQPQDPNQFDGRPAACPTLSDSRGRFRGRASDTQGCRPKVQQTYEFTRDDEPREIEVDNARLEFDRLRKTAEFEEQQRLKEATFQEDSRAHESEPHRQKLASLAATDSDNLSMRTMEVRFPLQFPIAPQKELAVSLKANATRQISTNYVGRLAYTKTTMSKKYLSAEENLVPKSDQAHKKTTHVQASGKRPSSYYLDVQNKIRRLHSSFNPFP